MADLGSAVGAFGEQLSRLEATEQLQQSRASAGIDPYISLAASERATDAQQQEMVLQQFMNQKVTELATKYTMGQQQIPRQDFFGQALFLDSMLSEMKVDPNSSVMEQRATAYMMSNPNIQNMWQNMQQAINRQNIIIRPLAADGTPLQEENELGVKTDDAVFREAISMSQLLARAKSGNIMYARNVILDTPAGQDDQKKKERADMLGLVYLSGGEDPANPKPRLLDWDESEKWKQESLLAARISSATGISIKEARRQLYATQTSQALKQANIDKYMASGLSVEAAEAAWMAEQEQKTRNAQFEDSKRRLDALAVKHPDLRNALTPQTAQYLATANIPVGSQDYNNWERTYRAAQGLEGTGAQAELAAIQKDIVRLTSVLDGVGDESTIIDETKLSQHVLRKLSDESEAIRAGMSEMSPEDRGNAAIQSDRIDQLMSAVNGNDPNSLVFKALDQNGDIAALLGADIGVTAYTGPGKYDGEWRIHGGSYVDAKKASARDISGYMGQGQSAGARMHNIEAAWKKLQTKIKDKEVGYRGKQLGSRGALEAAVLRHAMYVYDNTEDDGVAERARQVVVDVLAQQDSYAVRMTNMTRADMIDTYAKTSKEIRDKTARMLEIQAELNASPNRDTTQMAAMRQVLGQQADDFNRSGNLQTANQLLHYSTAGRLGSPLDRLTLPTIPPMFANPNGPADGGYEFDTREQAEAALSTLQPGKPIRIRNTNEVLMVPQQ